MTKLKYIIEKTGSNIYELSFNRDIDDILPRLATEIPLPPEVKNLPQGSVIQIGPPMYEPVKGLTGVEQIKPVGRYTIVMQFGRAFTYDDTIRSIYNILEMDVSDKDLEEWVKTVRQEPYDDVEDKNSSDRKMIAKMLKIAAETKKYIDKNNRAKEGNDDRQH